MLGQQTPISTLLQQTQIEKLVAACEKHAADNIYSGISGSNDLFMGWPLPDLVEAVVGKTAPISLKASVAISMKAKWAPRGVLGPSVPPAVQMPPHIPSNQEMLKMRMRWTNWGEGFSHVDVHQRGDTVHIWLVANDGQSIVLEDTASLFPSDATITKMNMLKGA